MLLLPRQLLDFCVQNSEMARSLYQYSFEVARDKLVNTCRELPSDKSVRVYSLINMWEPEKVSDTDENFECDFLCLKKDTLNRISYLLGLFKLQEGEYPMTHLGPFPSLVWLKLPASVLSPLPPSPIHLTNVQEERDINPLVHLELPLSLPPTASPIPSKRAISSPLSEAPLQPSASKVSDRLPLKAVFRKVEGMNCQYDLKDLGALKKAHKASKKRKSNSNADKESKENKKPRI